MSPEESDSDPIFSGDGIRILSISQTSNSNNTREILLGKSELIVPWWHEAVDSEGLTLADTGS